MLDEARRDGKNLFWALREQGESVRRVVIPGDWLTAFKTVAWVDDPEAAEALTSFQNLVLEEESTLDERS